LMTEVGLMPAPQDSNCHVPPLLLASGASASPN
jgi:hypothetical protein